MFRNQSCRRGTSVRLEKRVVGLIPTRGNGDSGNDAKHSATQRVIYPEHPEFGGK